MAQDWQAFPSAISTGVNSYDRTLVDDVETIGSPSDPPATNVSDENSLFSLMKGICAGLDVPAGTEQGVTNTSPRVNGDLLLTLGNMDDPPAEDTGRQSAISLMKGILVNSGLPA